MTEVTPTAPAAAASPIAEFEFVQMKGVKFTLDCTTVPADTRLDFLKTGLRAYIANRINAAMNRHDKDPLVTAWAAYDEASAADPLQSVVPKPDKDRPAAPDYADVYNRAVADLQAGNIRKQSDTPKARKVADPLISAITTAVVRAVYEDGRAKDAKYTYVTAKAAVGADGLEYLNKAIAAKVAAAPDTEKAALQAALEKTRDMRYVNPAKLMLGQGLTKAQSEMPNIL